MTYFSLQRNKKLPAFSLVEVLVAISILLLTIVTPMTIIARANNSTSFANEQIVAYFLAQEGLEIVQKLRDDIFLTYFNGGTTQFSRLTTNILPACSGQDCGIFMNASGVPTASACSSSSNCLLYFNTNASSPWARYVHASTLSAGHVATPYTRRIRLDNLGGEVRVTATVTWRTGSLIANQQVQLVTFLANVYDI